jgi:hypothetical protein
VLIIFNQKACEDVGTVFANVVEMLRDICHDLTTSLPKKLDDNSSNELMASLVDFLSFLIRTVRYFQRNPRGIGPR